ncbi:MAG: tetratricopeptide repeat protein [Treponema sp.]|nr:tetratricopeptide repeat protein [Treponema sp.]
MNFKEVCAKIWAKTKDIAGIVKEKLIIACKWIKEKTIVCAKKVKTLTVAGCTKFGNFCKQKFSKKSGTKTVSTKSKAGTKTTSKIGTKKETALVAAKGKTGTKGAAKAGTKTAAKNQKKEKKQLSPETKKKILIGVGVAALVIIILLLIRGCRSSIRQKDKTYAITYAMKNAEKGEYDRALDKLEDFLNKYGDDEDINNLWNLILDQKQNDGNGMSILDSQAMKDYLDALIAQNGDQIRRQQQILEDFMRQNGRNPNVFGQNGYGNGGNGYGNGGNGYGNGNGGNGFGDGNGGFGNGSYTDGYGDGYSAGYGDGSGNAFGNGANGANGANGSDGSGRLGETDEERAAREAEEAQKKLLEEQRRAEEEKLAKQNEAYKNQIDAVNNEIQKGKKELHDGKNNDGMKTFDKAMGMMPNIPGNTTFIPSKETEMAQAMYDAAQNTPNAADRERLYEKAVEYAKDAVSRNPNESQAHNILAQDALRNKDYNTAIKEFQAAANNKDDPNRYLYFYNLGKVQYMLKRYSDAEGSFKMSCSLKSDFAPSRFNLGLTQKQLGKNQDALASFRKTIEIDSKHEKAYLEQGRILAEREDYLGAIDAYKKVLSINNVNSSAAMELGSVYYKRNDLQNAEDSYRRAITMLPEGADKTLTKYNLSTVLYDSGKVDDAVRWAKEAYETKNNVKNNISKANVVYNYALVLEKTGKTNDAIPIYKEALTLNPDHSKSKINLGNMYMKMTPPEVDAALNLYLQVYNKESSNFEANNNLGSAYLLKDDYKNAIRFFQNALRIQPRNNEVRYNLAKTYAKNGDYENARTTYEDLVKADTKNWDAYIELAKVCMQLGDNESAKAYLKEVSLNNPTYRRADISTLMDAIE